MAACPTCSAEVSPDAPGCTRCGAALHPNGPVPPATQPWAPPSAAPPSGVSAPPPGYGPPGGHPPYAAPVGYPPQPGYPPTWGPGPVAYPPPAPVVAGDADRSNAIVLVVVSLLVAAGIIGLAVLATNDIGPNLDELERTRTRPSELVSSRTPPPVERTDGR